MPHLGVKSIIFDYIRLYSIIFDCNRLQSIKYLGKHNRIMNEDQFTELKSEYSDSLLKTAVAFSNCKGGRILVGIDDSGHIVGLNDSDDTCKKCVQGLADRIRPDITMTSDVRLVKMEDKDVVEIIVREGPKKPYYLRDKGCRPEGSYIRKGTTTVPTTDDAFYRMTHDYVSLKYEDCMSFRQDLTFRYLENALKAKGIAFDDDKMESLHLKNDDGYTNLGFMLSDQFDQPIRMAVFPDEYKSKFISRESVEGSVLEQADRAIAFIMKNNRTSSTFAGKYRVDVQAFPPVAVREAVLNAIVHRDYSMDASTLISIFPDKLMIVSPGNLNVRFSKEDLFRGVSSLRNKHLADIMYRMELIEAYGTGIPRMFNEYKDEEFGPEIEPGPSTFTIVLPAKAECSDSGIDLESFLSSGREFSRSELQDYLSVSRSGATQIVNDLISSGKIVRIGEGRTTSYRVL